MSEDQQVLKKIFNEKIHANVYQILVKNFDDMDILFQQLSQNNDINKKLAIKMVQLRYITPKNSDYID